MVWFLDRLRVQHRAFRVVELSVKVYARLLPEFQYKPYPFLSLVYPSFGVRPFAVALKLCLGPPCSNAENSSAGRKDVVSGGHFRQDAWRPERNWGDKGSELDSLGSRG